MAYTINKTDGTVLTTIADGTLDTTLDISLFGKNYAGFGELLNENQVKLLENFANTTSNVPTKALEGQLFYDTTLKQLQVYQGSVFKAVSGSNVSTSQPTVGSTGDLWFDSENEQVYVYNGSIWILIGPTTTAAGGGGGTSGSIATAIIDSTGITRQVVQSLVDGTIVSMISSVAFTPLEAITGFATVEKGLTLSTAISSNKFHGTATDADSVGGVAAANLLKANESDTTSGTLTIANDNSLVLGADADISFIQSGTTFTLKSTALNGNVNIDVNDGGVNTTAISINGGTTDVTFAANATVGSDLTVTGNLQVNGATVTNSATNTTVEDNIIVLNSGQTAGGAGGFDSSSGLGDSTVGNDIGILFNRGIHANVALIWDESEDQFALIQTTEDGTSTGNIAITSYATLRATATSAQYADLAERYHADASYEYGTVVKLGGDNEITKCTQQSDTDVFGVISEDPAFAMNSGAGPNSTHPYVALTGRVKCSVVGPVQKGDRLVSSATPGCAESANDLTSISPYAVIGRSLETSDSTGAKYLEIVVGKN
jgi:hypothetical protein